MAAKVPEVTSNTELIDLRFRVAEGDEADMGTRQMSVTLSDQSEQIICEL